MPHIDDGTLEAWLDRDRSGLTPAEVAAISGHLAECVECRLRFEEARDIRDRADAILARSGPARVAPPDFGVIAARAAKTPHEDAPREGRPDERDAWATPVAPPTVPPRITPPSTAPGWRRRLVATAWAASVVGAIGLGWLGREVSRSGRLAVLDRTENTEIFTESSPIDLPSPEVRPSSAAEPSIAAGAARSSAPTGSGSRVETVISMDAIVPTGGAAPVTAGAEAGGPGTDAAPTGGDPAPAVAFGARPPEAGIDIPIREPDVGASIAEEPLTRIAATGVAPSDPVAAQVTPPSMAAAPSGVARTLPAGSSATLDDDPVPTAWSPSNLINAATWLGAPIVTVSGRSVDAVEVASDVEVRAVRVTQTLDDGTPVYLVHRAERADPDMTASTSAHQAIAREVEDADPVALNTLTVRRPGVIITVSARLPADRLESLPLTSP